MRSLALKFIKNHRSKKTKKKKILRISAKTGQKYKKNYMLYMTKKISSLKTSGDFFVQTISYKRFQYGKKI